MSEIHPLKQYLLETGETVQAFASRIGVSRQTLHRLLNGDQVPKPPLARRIVEAAGGAIVFADLYAHAVNSETETVVDLAVHRPDDPELELDILADTLGLIICGLRAPDEQKLSIEVLNLAAEAIANTYSALSRVTTRHGHARLSQALRPVLEEILKEYSATRHPARHLDEAAVCATSFYYRCSQLRISARGQS